MSLRSSGNRHCAIVCAGNPRAHSFRINETSRTRGMYLVLGAYWPFLTHPAGDPLPGHDYRDINGKNTGFSFPTRKLRIACSLGTQFSATKEHLMNKSAKIIV